MAGGLVGRQYSGEEERRFDRLLYTDENRKRYRVVRGEDGIYEILCRRGDIEPCSLTELCCYQEFKSGRGVMALKGRLPAYCTVTQEAEREVVFRFPVEKLDEIAVLVHARRRRILTEEQKERLVDMGRSFSFKKQTPLAAPPTNL